MEHSLSLLLNRLLTNLSLNFLRACLYSLFKFCKYNKTYWELFILGLPMETIGGVRLVLRQTCGRHVHGIDHGTSKITYFIAEVS